MAYHERLLIKRRRQGIEQQELARLAKIHPSSLAMIERGLRRPRVSTRARLEKVLPGLDEPMMI